MYENKFYEDIKEAILGKMQGIDTREGSFVSDMVSPIAMELEGCYRELDQLLSMMFLEESVGEYIEKRAKEYGIFRKRGTYAKGEIVFTGMENTVIPKDTLVSTVTSLLFKTIKEVTIPKDATQIAVEVVGEKIGGQYNVLAHTVTQIPVAIVGITKVTNEKGFLGGTNIETDEELVNRVFLQIQNPATSGNAMHYKLWALEVDGVGDAKVFPLWNGAGTVKVIPITADKRSPSETIINDVRQVIEEKKPIGPTVTVVAPTEVMIRVNASIIETKEATLQQINEKYNTLFKEYIQISALKLHVVDYYKCLSLLYEIEGVKQVVDFKINNGTTNITIQESEVQVAGTVAIVEQVV